MDNKKSEPVLLSIRNDLPARKKHCIGVSGFVPDFYPYEGRKIGLKLGAQG